MRKAMALGASLLLWTLATVALAEGRWQQVSNAADCSVWNAYPQEDETVTWSGTCVNGKAEGYGEEIWRYTQAGERRRERYVGTMRGGKAHGRGMIDLANGDRYDGEWKDNLQDGQGVFTFANGDRYEGGFKAGVYHGEGTLGFASGERYEGMFEGGNFHGHGRMELASGNSYEGDFADGTLHGFGVFRFANGDQCAGEWREGKLLGTGDAVQQGERRKCYLDGSTIRYSD